MTILEFRHSGELMYRLATASVALLTGLAMVLTLADAESNTSPRTAEQAFKNIQVLKGIPADELIPSMQFMASSLGVRCDHCHVERAFEKDDKKPKQKAREMMKMMFALNQNNFSGQREVTCYSCHRGALRPISTPQIGDEPIVEEQTSGTSSPMPSADEILNKYITAVGGAASLAKINTKVEKGKISLAQGVQFPVEVYVKQPGMRSMVTHLPAGDSREVVRGEVGWMLVPERSPRRMNHGELEAAAMDADPHFAADIQSYFTEFKVQEDAEISGQQVAVIRASKRNQPPVRLYFNLRSGLLVRMIRYVDSPLGRNPTQIDYSDYRDVDGVKLPFQWTIAQPQGRYTVNLEQVSLNVPIEDSQFASPETVSKVSH